MITLSWFHEPPRAFGASASSETGPPDAEIFFKCPSAKNPMDFPSGDQKGNAAPSVPSSFFARRSLRDCTHRESRSLGLRAQYTIVVPSDVIAGGPEKSPVKSKFIS